MKQMSNYIMAAFCFMLVLAISIEMCAQDNQAIPTPYMLHYVIGKGLELTADSTVFVVVENLNDGAKAAGLSRDIISSKAVLRLRHNGIKSSTERPILKPYMYIHVTVVGQVYFVSLNFFREAYYYEGGKWHFGFAQVYSQGAYGNAGTVSDGRREVLDCVMDLVDMFSSDYFAANKR